MTATSRFETHEVFNQSPPYEDTDLFADNQALVDAVAANGGGGEAQALKAFGRRWGTADMFEQGRLANENPPKVRVFDSKGFRRDIVEFYPAYHRLMTESMQAGLHASTWRSDASVAAAPAEVARA